MKPVDEGICIAMFRTGYGFAGCGRRQLERIAVTRADILKTAAAYRNNFIT
jgi:hypothetical protein